MAPKKVTPRPQGIPSARSLMAMNKSLAADNAALSHKSQLLQSTIENSLGGLASGLLGGPNGPQSNLTSLNPMLQNNIYAPVTLMWSALMYMYKTHGLIQTAIDQPVLDAVRGGLDLHSDEIGSDIGRVEDWLEENGVLDRVVDSFIWARLFGGGALVVNSETDPEDPLGDEVMGGQVEFYDACRWELTCDRRIPFSGKYGFYGKTLDASRVITVVGKRAPYLIRAQLSDWGMSEIERMLEDFNSYIRNKNVIYELLEEAKVDVYSLDGFTSQLATSNGTALTTRRIQTMNQIKNFNNALIMDKKDAYEQKQLSFSGMAEIMKENRIGICSALRMPMSKLFGMGSTGFSSGEDDIENYNSLVESEVRQPMRQVIRKVLKVAVRHLFGEDMDISFKFRPLRSLTAVDEENIKASKSARYINLFDRLLMDSREVGEALQKDGLVPIALDAEKGLLDAHPVAAAGQPQLQSEPDAEPMVTSRDAIKVEQPEKPAEAPQGIRVKEPKAAPAEKPEQAAAK